MSCSVQTSPIKNTLGAQKHTFLGDPEMRERRKELHFGFVHKENARVNGDMWTCSFCRPSCRWRRGHFLSSPTPARSWPAEGRCALSTSTAGICRCDFAGASPPCHFDRLHSEGDGDHYHGGRPGRPQGGCAGDDGKAGVLGEIAPANNAGAPRSRQAARRIEPTNNAGALSSIQAARRIGPANNAGAH